MVWGEKPDATLKSQAENSGGSSLNLYFVVLHTINGQFNEEFHMHTHGEGHN